MRWALPLLGVALVRPSGRAVHITSRNALVYVRYWYMFVSGFAEPFLYLLSIGVGVGTLVGAVELDGRSVPYESFVAPGMLASAAMNGAVFDSTFSVFFKLKYARVYDAVLATPLGPRDVAVGEIGWALLRGQVYAAAFLVVALVAGLVPSWWALLALPAAGLIGFAFAAVGMAATTFMRSWTDFDLVNLVIVPLFLFSATFYPLSTYPQGLQLVVEATPLYHGVALVRALLLGEVEPSLLGHVAYLAAMGALGLIVAARRLERRLLP